MSQPIAELRRSLSARPRHHGFARRPALRFHPRATIARTEDRRPRPGRRCSPASPISTAGSPASRRTWLDPSASRQGADRPIRDAPSGDLLGNGVRFGRGEQRARRRRRHRDDAGAAIGAAHLPMIAALSANHLAATAAPLVLRRLYVARDTDAAGDMPPSPL